MLDRLTERTELVNVKLDQLPESVWKSKTTTFFDPAIGGGQFVAEIERRLRAHGHSNKNIASRVYGFEIKPLLDYAKNRFKLVGTYRVISHYFDIFKMENFMKHFDYCISNPPYTDNDVLLYTKFFEKCLNLADKVYFIMPVAIESQQVRLKAHNQRLKRHLMFKPINVSDYFKDIGYDNISWVGASKEIKNEIKDYVDPINNRPLLYPERKRIVAHRGSGKFARKSCWDLKGKEVYYSLHRGDKLSTKKVKKELVERTDLSRFKAPYFVFIHETASQGLFNSSIVENKRIPWVSGIFAIEAKTKQEAKKLKNWLQSKEIQKEVFSMLKAKGSYSCSGPMINRLPWYE